MLVKLAKDSRITRSSQRMHAQIAIHHVGRRIGRSGQEGQRAIWIAGVCLRSQIRPVSVEEERAALGDHLQGVLDVQALLQRG